MPVGHRDAPVPLRMNDAKCSPEGILFAGSMFIEEYPEAKGASALYRVEDSDIKLVLPGVTLSNGLGWSPDGSTMYYVDTRTQRIDKFDYSLQTGPINRRTFVEISESDGNPDGLCTDQEGGVWLALWGASKVVRFSNSGQQTEVVTLPTPHPTSVCFYGPHMNQLAITTASMDTSATDTTSGSTFTIDAGVAGCVVATLKP